MENHLDLFFHFIHVHDCDEFIDFEELKLYNG